eukprot:CAMPEP_0204609446 /NCGR_PEP_ID=MMETSP0661-20131031/60921_1 /ASSEMBLY_ACC=CAM_ASM_000606 /TAXON_ID=109239 /ORGANISM="Alexandrium margalefi, Strain AMGDE01CS-322" /LENGTH=207 /DNA_ID=CAMNT_0051621115 /DNA_START=80 /DNA_END=700 /DNA_ORIENTATION=-
MFDFDEIETDVKKKGADSWKEAGGKEEKAVAKAAEPAKSPVAAKPKQDDVTIRVGYIYKGQRWHQEHKVKRGTTVLELKKQMTTAKAEEASWFQLMKGGLPAEDSEALEKDMRLEFAYLPPRTPIGIKKLDMGEAPSGGWQGEVEVTVCFDPISLSSTSYKVKKGSTVLELKEKMAKEDPTGSTEVQDFELAVNGPGGRWPLDGATL